jgi:uncharacterized protein YndB with AHSA1/START domain
MREGGRSEYAMTGPQGGSSRGYWVFERVEPPGLIEVRDGFLCDDGTENTEMPTIHMRMTFEATPRGSRFVSVSTFTSLEALEELVAMGMLDGMRAAMGQIDAVLADLRDYARAFPAQLELVDDARARVTREVRGRIDQVWRAHHEAELMKRWMLGPDGWTMPVCEVATEVGQTYRYEWENEADGARFGFTGELLETEVPRRAVTTEQMIGMDGPGTVNELTLTPRPGDRTLITVAITYPSPELREQILATGMIDGMEASYARLEAVTGP